MYGVIHSSVIFPRSDFLMLKSIKVTYWDQLGAPFQSTVTFIIVKQS